MVKELFIAISLPALLLVEHCYAEEFVIEKNSRWLIELEQTSSDLIVHVETQSGSFQIDHPSGHVGPELFFIGPYPEVTSVGISATAKTRSQRLDYKLKVISTTNADSELAALINRSGEIYAETGLTVGLTDVYMQAIDRPGLSASVRDTILYLAANSALLARQPNLAKEIVKANTFSGECEAYCYKQSMLLGLIEFEALNYPDAVQYMQKALLKLQELSLTKAMQMEKAELLSTYGFALALNGESDSARLAIEEAESLAYSLGDQGVQAWVLNMQANFQAFSGDLIKARETLVKAADMFERNGDSLSQADGLINLSMLHKLLGDYQPGIVAAQKAIKLVQEAGSPGSMMGSAYDRLANLYEIIGDWERAAQLFELAYEHEKNQGNLSRAMRIRGQIASNLRELGQLSAAEALHRESLRFFVGDGDAGETIVLRQELALDLIKLGRLPEAMSEIETAIRLQHKAPGFVRIDELNLVRASILRNQLKFDAAHQLLESSLDEFDLNDTPLGTQISYGMALMQVFKEMNNLDQAIEIGHQVLAQVKDVRTDLEIRRLGPAWSRQTHSAVSGLADIYMQRYLSGGDIEDAISAFEILESGQASALRNQITSNANRINNLQAEQLELEQRLTIIANKRASALSGSSELEELTAEYYQVLELREASRTKSFSNEISTGRKLKDLQQLLPVNNFALRFYCPEPSRCWLFSFDKNDFDATPIVYKNLEQLIHSANNKLRVSATAESELDKLSSTLNISRFLHGSKKGDQLLISADYPFNLLPFAALPLPGGQELIDQYAVVSSPSLTGMITATDDPDFIHSLDLAVVADPVFGGLVSDKNTVMPVNQDALRNWSDRRQRLPWSAEEAKSLEELYKGSRLGVYVGEQANRANLLDLRTRNARVLHIASHAYFNEATPDLVGIAISPDKSNEGTGFITLDELLSYPMNNELVVISGCETGTGQYYPGEGDMSLARGFHAKGTRKVLSTRWPVSDRASALFMRYFHEGLRKQGLAAEFALVSAQKKMKQNPRYRAPFYWAGYVLSSTRL